MHLVQILLPLYDNEGERFGEEHFCKVRQVLTERFGGLTAYTQAPAKGLWKDEGATRHDDIVVFEVMVKELDAGWWRDYRAALEREFRQDEIVIRAQEVRVL
jgi:hypothetical protein